MRFAYVTAGCLLVVSTLPAPVAADETGLASSHTLRKEAGKLCMADHFHSGYGAGGTKETARAAAARAWVEFVDFEYGTNWAHYGRAASVSVKYGKEEKGWSATIEARPCK